MHDIGEAWVRTHLDALGLGYEDVGFDPHENGERVFVDGNGALDDEADFLLSGADVLLDVKTYSHEEHVGNLRERQLEKYERNDRDVWIVAMVVDTDTGESDVHQCYRVSDVAFPNTDTTPWGHSYRVPERTYDMEHFAGTLV